MQRIGDSAGLFALLPRLRKLKDMDDVALDAFETPAVRDEITRLTKAADLAGLDAAWRALPRYLRERPALVCAYVDALSTLGQTARAESVLRNALRHAWHDTLIDLYGSMPHQDLPRAIAFAERFLRERELERNAALLLALGRLCRRERLWGKARGYFDASLASQPRPDTYRELGDLLEQLGERDPARHCFRKGLRLAAEGVLDNGQTLYLPTRRRAPELPPPPRKGDEELHTV
jgi:HemY protein